MRVAGGSSKATGSASLPPGWIGASGTSDDLRGLAVDGHRAITFTMGMGGGWAWGAA